MAVSNIQNERSLRRIKGYLYGLIPLALITVYLYGLRPAILISMAVVLAILSDLFVAALRRRSPDFAHGDLSSIVWSLVFTLMLPASVNYGILTVGVLITVLLGKHAFGGYTGCVFHPAAFSFCGCAICWQEELFRYPTSFSTIGLGWNSGAIVNDAPAYTIKLGGVPNIDKIDLLLGDFPGPMGATFFLILISILVLFMVLKTVTWHIPVAYLVSAAIYAYVFPRIQTTRPESVMFELMSGAVVFAAVFIVSDPFTSPVNPRAKLIYGALLGILTMIFSHFGAFQMGACFAVLLLGPLVPYIDRRLAPREATVKGGARYGR